MAEKMDSEREAFEKWASEYGFTKFDKTSTGAYKTFVSRALFDSFRAGVNHLAQPAQAVDVGAILELACQFKNDEFGVDEFQEKLTRALTSEKAGPVGEGVCDERKEYPDGSGYLQVAFADGVPELLGRSVRVSPASPAPDKEGA